MEDAHSKHRCGASSLWVTVIARFRFLFCGKAELNHSRADREYKRDGRIPEWHGWHAARRGLGSNLYHLGVPEMVIQRILRHANVSTTATYYIKRLPMTCRDAMAKLESNIPAPKPLTDTFGTLSERATPRPRALQ